MEKSDLIGKSAAELRGMRVGFEKELFNFRFQRVGQALENTARVRTVRRDIARIKTMEAVLAKGSVFAQKKSDLRKKAAVSKAAQ